MYSVKTSNLGLKLYQYVEMDIEFEKNLLLHQKIEQNQGDLLTNVVVPFMKKIKAFYMIMKLRDAYRKAPLAYWKRMELFVMSLNICVLVVY